MLIFIILIQKFLTIIFSEEIPINNYFLKESLHKNITISNYPIPYNCLSFEAGYFDYLDNLEDTYDSPIIENLKIIILFSDDSSFDIKIIDNDNKRYEIPSRYPFPKDLTLNASCKSIEKALASKYEPSKPRFMIFLNKSEEKIEMDNPALLYKIILINKPFAIQVLRKSTGEYIYDSTLSDFIFSDKYIEFHNRISMNFIMGFGERNFKTRLDVGHIYTTWSRDQPNQLEDGLPPGENSYGFHPMYLVREDSGKFNIGYLRISTAFDVILLEDSLRIIMIGGIIHWKYFLGDESPNNVVIKYHQYIGGYAIPPFWAMGLHQSRWGYKNITEVLNVIKEYEIHQIPFDAIHLDIDYMFNRQMFQVDQINFNKSHFLNFPKHLIPIVDVGVYPNITDPDVFQALNKTLFIRDSADEFFLGRCWPGSVIFPDFFHPEIKFYWDKNLKNLHFYLNYSGIWLDMNEISNFCDGECSDNPIYLLDKYKKFREEEFEAKFPYLPGERTLQSRSISINALHYDDQLELNLHPLNGLLQTFHTYNFLKYNLSKKIPFILTRSTYPGSGKYAFHWTGDILSDWSFMQLSIPSMFSFNLFGIPMVGSDICGFEGNTNEILCARWAQLGSFYPFARNHNHEHSIDQEFHKLGPTVLETAKQAFKMRYSILKYYYSLFILAKGKGMIIQPFFFEWSYIDFFYDDEMVDKQFLIGKEIICIPILEVDSNFTIGYFPNEPFYDFTTGYINFGNLLFLYIPLNLSLPLYVRAGSIIHFQNVLNVSSTKDLNNRFKLFVAMKRKKAHGFFIGFEEYSEDNIANCISHNYECKWEISFELKKKGMFLFEIQLEFLLNEKTLKNNGSIIIEEIHLIGWKENFKHEFQSFDKGKIFVDNQDFNYMNYRFMKEVDIMKVDKKIIIKCEFSKNLYENEKMLIYFGNESEANFIIILVCLIFLIFSEFLFLNE